MKQTNPPGLVWKALRERKSKSLSTQNWPEKCLQEFKYPGVLSTSEGWMPHGAYIPFTVLTPKQIR